MATDVRNNPKGSRYELFVDDQLAGIADYDVVGETVVFPHTEIRGDMRGKGLGDVLVGAALDNVRATSRRVEARCWFVAQFIDEHPEYRDLLAA